MSDFTKPLETVVYFDCSEDMADVAFGELYKFISNLPYPEKQIITNALGKLKLLEEQGCKVDFITVKEFSEECIKDVCDEFKTRMSHGTCQILEESGNKAGRTDYKIVYEFLEKCYDFCDDTGCENCPFSDDQELCFYLSGIYAGTLKPWCLTEEVYEEIMKER